ncbi:Major facilitator superfamily domain-containing protein 9 [Frankliniella fusca]|uniref:Major facilitator superfamily domain-containing protein 9 n=1 Tax=Frankliniella fusca TaxID=407009 RepID=A0AAE1GRU2_9NEOP|nr:Major facilitator superfamily domain-containing protein 9 [Frankliniella fusca]
MTSQKFQSKYYFLWLYPLKLQRESDSLCLRARIWSVGLVFFFKCHDSEVGSTEKLGR